MRHLVAFGGWNGPHPDEKLNGKEWFEVWRAWNVAHGFVFDGCDWDLEGNPTGPTELLEEGMVALRWSLDFCREAKQHGYLIALAPAESYLDAGSSEVDLRLNHEPRAPWRPGENGFPAAGFPYAGRNAYAAILARAGMDSVDAVSVQLSSDARLLADLVARLRASTSAYRGAAWQRTQKRSPPAYPRKASPSGPTCRPSRFRAASRCSCWRSGWADNEKFITSGARRRRARRGSRGLAGGHVLGHRRGGLRHVRRRLREVQGRYRCCCLLGALPRSCGAVMGPWSCVYARSLLALEDRSTRASGGGGGGGI